MTDSIYYVNGEYVRASEGTLPVVDLAILRGYGVFDYLRTYNGVPFQLMRNIRRLRTSAGVIELAVPWSDEEIHDIVMETVKRNGYDEASVRIVVTGGETLDFITPEDKPRLIVMVEPMKPLPAEWYTEGVKIITMHEERQLPAAKSLNYIPAIIAQKRARAAGGVEAIYVDGDGYAREGTTTNLFAFYGNTLVTPPPSGILPGITRETLLRVLEGEYAVDVRELTLEELLMADEVFITAANKRVTPVVTIDEHTIGNGRVGELTRHVMELFDVYTGIKQPTEG